MAKLAKLEPVLETETVRVERVLGADIETATYEELSIKFDEVRKEYEEKTYAISLNQELISLLLMEILPKVQWVGQQAWDIAESQKVIVELKPNVVSNVSREAIRSLFQFVATNKYVGVDHVSQVSKLLTLLAEVIQFEIAKDEQLLRDAGFELQAAEQGILPETAMQNVMMAQNASANN